MITRNLEGNIMPLLGKAIVIMGTRQVGKSTLLRQILGDRKGNVKCPESFKTSYPDAEFKVITPKNVEEFLMV